MTIMAQKCAKWHARQTPVLWPPLQDNLGKPAPGKLDLYDFNEARHDGVAVTSAGPYTYNWYVKSLPSLERSSYDPKACSLCTCNYS